MLSVRYQTAVLLASIGLACAHRYFYPDPKIVAMEQRATAEAAQVAGCYALNLGPWRAPDSSLIDSMRWDTPNHLPPAVVRLDAEDSRVPVLGHFRLTPLPVADTGFRYASWRGNQGNTHPRMVSRWVHAGHV
jgi:hypothetical protein